MQARPPRAQRTPPRPRRRATHREPCRFSLRRVPERARAPRRLTARRRPPHPTPNHRRAPLWQYRRLLRRRRRAPRRPPLRPELQPRAAACREPAQRPPPPDISRLSKARRPETDRSALRRRPPPRRERPSVALLAHPSRLARRRLTRRLRPVVRGCPRRERWSSRPARWRRAARYLGGVARPRGARGVPRSAEARASARPRGRLCWSWAAC
jgi:hypothetical protein